MTTEIVPAEHVEPWEKQPGETDKAWIAFVAFRDLGPQRTIEKAANAVGASMGMLYQWSSRYDWRPRVDAYDRMLDARWRKQREDAAAEANQRHIQEARALQTLAMRRVAGDPANGVAALSPGELGPTDVLAFVDRGIKWERIGLGQPSDMLRGSVVPTAEDVRRVLQAMYSTLMRFVPEELQDAAAEAVENLSLGGR